MCTSEVKALQRRLKLNQDVILNRHEEEEMREKEEILIRWNLRPSHTEPQICSPPRNSSPVSPKSPVTKPQKQKDTGLQNTLTEEYVPLKTEEKVHNEEFTVDH